MSIFDVVNDKFFNPFSCKNRSVYFNCITELIEKSKEIPVLYELDARNTLILYLQNSACSIEAENIGEDVSNFRTPQENASAILRYFRTCGWITAQEIGRSGDNIAAVSAGCRKLIEAIHKIFDGEAGGAITNHIFSMYEILKSAFEKDSARAIRPYQNVLVPLVENECDLKNELLILRDSIREIMRAVVKMSDANSFGQFLIRDELLERFFNDYFFIKKSGLMPAYIADIDRMLRKLRASDLYDRMLEEYMRITNMDEIYAKEKIDRQFGTLDGFINYEYDREMGYIDRKINTYYNLYTTRMLMVLSGKSNLQSMLNRLLLMLKDMSPKEKEKVLANISKTHSLQSTMYVGRKSFERRQKRNSVRQRAEIVQSEVSVEEIQRMTEELMIASPDRYSLDDTKQYADWLMRGRNQISLEECGIRSREDAMMIAACIIYSGTDDFPYETEFQNGMTETEAARISSIIIKRKKADTNLLQEE